jgi:hypothetical protein
MRRITGQRFAVLLAAVTAAGVTAGMAAPAAQACTGGSLTCASGSSNANGQIAAGAQAITITTHGGKYHSKTASAPVPASVMPPCFYTPGRTGAELAADHADPNLRRTAHGVGDNFDDWFPPDWEAHANDDGVWWDWECDQTYFHGTTAEFLAFVDQWSAGRGPVFVPAGTPPPVVPVPPEVLEAIARQYLDDTVRMPVVTFNPDTRTFVNLETWMWFDQAATEPVSVTASAGGNSVTVTATPSAVAVGGLPPGSSSNTTCANGGTPYTPGATTTDCFLKFGQSSGGQSGGRWPFTVSMSWQVTSVGAALIGPPVITLSEDEALQVLEAQTVTN